MLVNNLDGFEAIGCLKHLIAVQQQSLAEKPAHRRLVFHQKDRLALPAVASMVVRHHPEFRHSKWAAAQLRQVFQKRTQTTTRLANEPIAFSHSSLLELEFSDRRRFSSPWQEFVKFAAADPCSGIASATPIMYPSGGGT